MPVRRWQSILIAAAAALLIPAPALASPGTPARLSKPIEVRKVTARRSTNPVTGAPSDSLLIVTTKPLPEAAGGSSVRVLVTRPASLVGPSGPDDLVGTQWIIEWTGRAFRKAARERRGRGWVEVAAGPFNVRVARGRGRGEVEFYGPVGTGYFAALATDGTACDVAAPLPPGV